MTTKKWKTMIADWSWTMIRNYFTGGPLDALASLALHNFPTSYSECVLKISTEHATITRRYYDEYDEKRLQRTHYLLDDIQFISG